MSYREEIYKANQTSKNSETAWDSLFKIIEFYFNILKDVFSDLYRDHNPLATDLKYENAVRSLSAQHLLHLGDLCKYRAKFEKKSKKKEIAEYKEQSWNFYTRAKTLYPFDGRIYNQFASLSVKEHDELSTVCFLMRSLASNIPHEASKEFLIDYFEELRLKYTQSKNEKTNSKK